ncbi:helix-turn-helix domain-containing protein [Christensenellaceae bacterium OttesenSCG-928-M15]|nr:helix-turn-helix domain-containing protein [Christensenellaceae bacterium OttesenSCG-928-M15]
MNVNVRQYRKERKITISKLADETGLSVGYISQIERGLVEPSLSTLRKIGDVLGVSLFLLIDEDRPDDIMAIRNEDHLMLRNKEDTVIYEFLTPLPTEAFIPKSLIIRFTLLPHSQVSEEQLSHPSEELVTILSGKMVLCMGMAETTLVPGDSCVIRTDMLHNFRNDFEEPLVGLSCFTPPVWSNKLR